MSGLMQASPRLCASSPALSYLGKLFVDLKFFC
jgi:hypothetical protein